MLPRRAQESDQIVKYGRRSTCLIRCTLTFIIQFILLWLTSIKLHTRLDTRVFYNSCKSVERIYTPNGDGKVTHFDNFSTSACHHWNCKHTKTLIILDILEYAYFNKCPREMDREAGTGGHIQRLPVLSQLSHWESSRRDSIAVLAPTPACHNERPRW